MECLKLTHLSPSFSDDLLATNGDDFSVVDLLSFPTDAGFVEENNNSQVYDTNNGKNPPVKTVYDGKTTIPETELCFPVTDVEDVDWVSQFVDDSFSGEYSLTFPVRKFPENETKTETETVTLVDINPAFKNSVHKRTRTKRRRTGAGVWSLRSSSPLTDSSTSSSSTSSCTSKPLLVSEEILGKPPVQLQERKPPVRVGSGSGSGSGQVQPRRCSHCLVQKTPQWRTGPLGAKTLCNACGVRYKSGRLLPEYRPACSPTFSSKVHSNNHRKVLEIRRKKTEALVEGGGLRDPV